MAAIYGIIRNHGGGIGVDSQLGKGTVVRVYLPAMEAKEGQVGTIPELVKGSGTVLIIEDEEDVLNVAKAMLEKLGYVVLEARSGLEGIRITRNFEGDIDFVILDIGLPDMGGEKVYPELIRTRPNLRVMVCSGYAVDGPAQEILDKGAQGFIQKPFSMAELSAKLRLASEGE